MDCKIVCLLALIMATAVSAGQEYWQSDCACARIYQPMCASDGSTYNNKCLFECRAKAMGKKGQTLSIVKYNQRCDGTH